MENMEFMKAMLAEMNTKIDASTKAMQERMEAKIKEMMEKQIGLLAFIMEAAGKTDRDETKQEIRAGQEPINEIMETNFGSQATQVDGWSKQMQAD
jgi:hypothetical protein